MEKSNKLSSMSIDKLYSLKTIVDSISNMYAEQLTDYALISGDNSLSNMPKEKLEIYEKRNKYKYASNLIQSILIEKVDNLIC